MRPVANDDLWSAIRGLELFRMSNSELIALRQHHVGNDTFASRVISEATRQVLEIRTRGGKQEG